MTTICATSVLASVHALDQSKRLDTLLLRYPRCIHAEFMTHRMFSRNAGSSRAIPVEKLIQDVLDDPFVPLHWGKNQKGMQAHEEMQGLALEQAKDVWSEAKDAAIRFASELAALHAHKQLVNRLLEPFGHITVVVTSSNWSNFLALRDHKDAEPHIQILAQLMRMALENAEVQVLNPGVWHLPFISNEEHDKYNTDELKKLSVARCASTSYKTVEGFDMTMERAEAIYEKLYTMRPAHASPFEHVAQADDIIDDDGFLDWSSRDLSGNFEPGWIQLRKTMAEECL